MMKNFKKLLLAMALVLMVIGLLPAAAMAAESQDATGSGGTVTVAVEKFVLGKGYLIAPQQVAIADGATAADAVYGVIGDGKYVENTTYHFLTAIADSSIKKGTGNDISAVPSFIQDAIKKDSKTLTDTATADGYLSAYDFTADAGWTYSVDNAWPSVGMNEYKVKDGDVIRVAFSLYGYGGDWANTGFGTPLRSYADLTGITATLARAKTAKLDSSAEYTAAVAAASDLTADQTAIDAANAALTAKLPASVTYQTQIQNKGWEDAWAADGQTSGTEHQSLRLEAIRIKLADAPYAGSIQYRTHIQNKGWEENWSADGADSGTVGQSLRLEAIQIKLSGDMADKYDVYYRVHAQNIGWMNWAKNGESAGTAGYGYRLEAIQIELVAKGGAAPAGSGAAFQHPMVEYNTHVQDVGWQDMAMDGQTSGTVGQSKRLEGIHISLSNQDYTGSIQYKTHIQNVGWEENWSADGAMSGTEGQSLRLEAIQIQLTDQMAANYDVYYQVHAQNIGWMGWAKNGESAGTAGYAYRLEGIRIQLVAKGGAAPGSTEKHFQQK